MPARVEVGAHGLGWTTDGSAWSSASVEGLIWVENSSAYDATAYFRVSGALSTEVDVTGNSLGQAFSYASILLSSSTGATWVGWSEESVTTRGPDSSSLALVPAVYSMTVPPGWGHYFSAFPHAEGYAVAVPSRVPEPLFSTLLAAGLAVLGLLRRRMH